MKVPKGKKKDKSCPPSPEPPKPQDWDKPDWVPPGEDSDISLGRDPDLPAKPDKP
jgi:hypothetical protein